MEMSSRVNTEGVASIAVFFACFALSLALLLIDRRFVKGGQTDYYRDFVYHRQCAFRGEVFGKSF